MAKIPFTLAACQERLQLLRRELRNLKAEEILLMDAVAKKTPRKSLPMANHLQEPEENEQ